MISNIHKQLALIAALSFGMAACSSSSDNPTSEEPDTQKGTINSPVTGPLIYNTGSIVTGINMENFVDSGLSSSFVIETDEDNMTINKTNGLDVVQLPGLFYDENGQVTKIDTSPTSTPLSVSYNDDGSLASIYNDRGDSTSTSYFQYESGRLISRTLQNNPNGGLQSTSTTANYHYDQNGLLIGATQHSPSPSVEHQYVLNSEGRIIEILENTDGLGNFESRSVLSYDAAGNMTQMDVFSTDGMLNSRATVTYMDSPGSVPNMVGFLSAADIRLIPSFNVSNLFR